MNTTKENPSAAIAKIVGKFNEPIKQGSNASKCVAAWNKKHHQASLHEDDKRLLRMFNSQLKKDKYRSTENPALVIKILTGGLSELICGNSAQAKFIAKWNKTHCAKNS